MSSSAMPHEPRPEFVRSYESLHEAATGAAGVSCAERMQAAVDAIWEAFGGDGPGRGISWIGFYGLDKGGDQMTLLARRDKPACSPIGMHGACGRACNERRAIVVDDVASLGEGYIACDPRDLSELVVPLFENGGRCWGVLDADSYERAAFSEPDVEGLAGLVEVLGLSTSGGGRGETLHL